MTVMGRGGRLTGDSRADLVANDGGEIVFSPWPARGRRNRWGANSPDWHIVGRRFQWDALATSAAKPTANPRAHHERRQVATIACRHQCGAGTSQHRRFNGDGRAYLVHHDNGALIC